MTILAALLSLTLLILSSVALGSANKMNATKMPSEDDVKNAKRSSTGLVVISIVLVMISAVAAYGEFKPKQQSIYYF
jgi:hypothetical protein